MVFEHFRPVGTQFHGRQFQDPERLLGAIDVICLHDVFRRRIGIDIGRAEAVDAEQKIQPGPMSGQVGCCCGHLIDAVQAPDHGKVSELNRVLALFGVPGPLCQVCASDICAEYLHFKTRVFLIVIDVAHDDARGKLLLCINLVCRILQGLSGRLIHAECGGIQLQDRRGCIDNEPAAPGLPVGLSAFSSLYDCRVARRIRIAGGHFIVAVLRAVDRAHVQVPAASGKSRAAGQGRRLRTAAAGSPDPDLEKAGVRLFKEVVLQDLDPGSSGPVIVLDSVPRIDLPGKADADDRLRPVDRKGIGSWSVPLNIGNPVAQSICSADLQGVVAVGFIVKRLDPSVPVARFSLSVCALVLMRRQEGIRNGGIGRDPDFSVLDISVNDDNVRGPAGLEIFPVLRQGAVVKVHFHPGRCRINAEFEQSAVPGRRRAVSAVVPCRDRDREIVGLGKGACRDADESVPDLIDQGGMAITGSPGIGIGDFCKLHSLRDILIPCLDFDLHLLNSGASFPSSGVLNGNLQVQRLSIRPVDIPLTAGFMAGEAAGSLDFDLRRFGIPDPGDVRGCHVQIDRIGPCHGAAALRIIRTHISGPVFDDDVLKKKCLLAFYGHLPGIIVLITAASCADKGIIPLVSCIPALVLRT